MNTYKTTQTEFNKSVSEILKNNPSTKTISVFVSDELWNTIKTFPNVIRKGGHYYVQTENVTLYLKRIKITPVKGYKTVSIVRQNEQQLCDYVFKKVPRDLTEGQYEIQFNKFTFEPIISKWEEPE